MNDLRIAPCHAAERGLESPTARHIRRSRPRTKLALLVAGLALVGLAHGASLTNTYSFDPTDDAYLDGTTRFNDQYLRIRGNTRVSYLKFSVTGLSGTVQNATLRLQENGNTGSGTFRFHRGSHNNWTETTLSTVNAPSTDGEVGSFTGVISSGLILHTEITPLIVGDGTYSIIINQDAGGNDVRFGSKESSRKPRLTIETIEPVTFTLTVNGGTGSGFYEAGSTIAIVANPAPVGQLFEQWTGDTASVADPLAASTSLIMPSNEVTVTASYRSGGIGFVGPIGNLTATGDAGMITTINGLPVSELLSGVTTFPNPPAFAEFPAGNADNFDLGLIGSADNQPFFDCSFGQPVMGVFLIESGGNDSGRLQALDVDGNPVGNIVPFTNSDFLSTRYRSGNNQPVAGLAVWMTAAFYGIRVLPLENGALGFDPTSISASLRPRLELQGNPADGSLQLVWFGETWVLQRTSAPDTGWSDVAPPARSPFPVITEDAYQWFRLREAGSP
jgi:hypothetical protein